jgi:hypothetical protein
MVIHNILIRWKSFFSQLLKVHNVSNVKQTKGHIVEPLVPDHIYLEAETDTAKLKKYKSPGSN